MLVFNDSKVLPVRLHAKKKTGGKVELLLIRPVGERSAMGEGTFCERWESAIRGKVAPACRLYFEDGVVASVMREIHPGQVEIAFFLPVERYPTLIAYLHQWGDVPLPPYITKIRGNAVFAEDAARYQTVYAKAPGSAAAPTAGLHFTESLIQKIKTNGVKTGSVTLHVGPDTFKPMRSETLDDHVMHGEWFSVEETVLSDIDATKRRGGRVIAIGTTTTRALESYDRKRGKENETFLFIKPGHLFQVVDALITNFHLPKSTLLVLVSALVGHKALWKIYHEAIKERYRFYSFGDAMFIV